MRDLSERDVHGALAVVAEAASCDSGGPFGLGVLERLREFVGVDHASAYIEYKFDSYGWSPWSIEYPAIEYPAHCEWMELNPLREEVVGRSEIPITLSDVLTPRELRRNPYMQEVLRPAGVAHELKLFLPAPEGTTYEFDFTRGPGRDFDERDRSILLLLRPHLTRLRRRWEQSIHPASLTAREREIIRHVARGLTNREIAEQLVVSTNTVRSHLDHIYDKLGVHTRTAAVAAATNPKRQPPPSEPKPA